MMFDWLKQKNKKYAMIRTTDDICHNKANIVLFQCHIKNKEDFIFQITFFSQRVLSCYLDLVFLNKNVFHKKQKK
jgi:hypothetical protein